MQVDAQLAERFVLITGVDGFVGSHLTKRLADSGQNVHAFVRATLSSEFRNIRPLVGDITVHQGNIRDQHLIRQALSALADYDDVIILHLSAQAQVIESWHRPYETVQTNTVGR